ncbi:MAG: biotin/lipoyl-containing protein [Candidatus Fimivivens sp.]|nr:biotin/lipoyl-containing protein [Candidatus Fimivivens sp.]
MKYTATLNGRTYDVEIERTDVFRPLTREEIATGAIGASAPIVVNATPAPVAAAPAPAPAAPAPAPAPVKAVAPAAPVPAGAGTITAPMSGTIFKMLANVGDTVKNGQVIVVLEAMKMENEIFAPCDGTVKEVRVAQGAAVAPGDVLVVIG